MTLETSNVPGTLLVTAADFAPLFQSEDFVDRLIAVVDESLRAPAGEEYASFLRFPAGAEGCAFQLYPVASPARGCFVRLGPTDPSRRCADASVAVHLHPETGRVLGMMSLDTLGPWRTAAPVIATIRRTAPRRARTLAMIGAGEQAHFHVRGLARILPELRAIRVFSRTEDTRRRFADAIAPLLGSSVAVTVAASAEAACAEADVVCVTAAGRDPAVLTSWLRPGAVVTSILPFGVGVDVPVRRMAPTRERPLVRASGWDPYPIDGPAAVAAQADVTLQEIVRGEPARSDASQTLVYVQLGPGPWDTAILGWARDWAVAAGAGRRIHFSS